MMYEYFVELAV